MLQHLILTSFLKSSSYIAGYQAEVVADAYCRREEKTTRRT
jgi:hypothetical protein